MKKYIFISLSFILSLFYSCKQETGGLIDLSGTWEFQLDSLNVGQEQHWYSTTLKETIVLPGTIDSNQKGNKNLNKEETSYLSREYYYVGKAWYSKSVEIPVNWKNKSIFLTLERTKPAQVWVDNTYIGSSDDISTKQVYDLSAAMTPGTHKITVLIDNGASVPKQVIANSHAYTESTQTNWNGIIGKITLEAKPQVYIEDVQVYTYPSEQKGTLKLTLNMVPKLNQSIYVTLAAKSFNSDKRSQIHWQHEALLKDRSVAIDFPLGDDFLMWSEFEPNLYKMKITVKGEKIKDQCTTTFGIRDFQVKEKQFTINGLTTYLRGKHDACVFPLTGYVAMDVDTWRHYFKVAKDYGINHYRFHSWCPPEACFEAADLEGIYLQPELPIWGSLTEKDTVLNQFLMKEGMNIQQAYSNHASFVMMGLGNELSGEASVFGKLVKAFREQESRHLYTSGSNNYLGYKGYNEWDDYFTTCRVPGDNSLATHTRGSFSFADVDGGGYINTLYPNTTMNFDTAVRQSDVPVISHETGQFQIYPDYDQLKKYTGNLKPWNLEVFKKRLEQAGMADQAYDFFVASGKWAVELYRADIEMDLRTRKMAGFQLLDLQDYPGQGSAYVGILDAFMDSKGLIEPAKWREFCSEVVPLLEIARFTFAKNEDVKAEVKIANYSATALKDKQLSWKLMSATGNVLDEGTMPVNAQQGALTSVGTIRPKITGAQQSEKCMLSLQIDGTDYQNSYPIWVYDLNHKLTVPDDIRITHSLDQSTLVGLVNGGKVLFMPDKQKYKDITVGGLFQTDYWNYRMFKTVSERLGKEVSPGTLGILTDPSLELFRLFPTDQHTNWQWFPIVKASRPLILDRLGKNYKPLVQVIDNIERNHKLGLIFELAVGQGKLLVCMADLETLLDYPEGKALYESVLHYMSSDSFNPNYQLDASQLAALFSSPVVQQGVKGLDNFSY
ncbi:MAG: beta-glycosidase [Phocaeicola sp.]|nr:beta-glycosidase [Phocaeicola sp.]